MSFLSELSKKVYNIIIFFIFIFLFFNCEQKYEILPVRSDSFQKKISSHFLGVERHPQKKIIRKASKIDWSKETIYFIVIDRFNDADKSNDYYVDRSNPFAWHGGDLQGIIDKLDYIKKLGFTAIWITPPVDNDELPTSKKYHFYHGYHAKDFYSIDEHFGDIKLYQQFVDKAHAKGIKIIQDIVFNQTGFTHRFVKDNSFYTWFHHGKTKGSHETKEEYEELFGSPDFNQSNLYCRNFLIDYAKYWLEQVSLDGYRLDAMKHINYDFWPIFSREIKNFAGDGFFLIGEVLSRNQNDLNKYFRSHVDSLVDFPLHYIIQDVFKNDMDISNLSKFLSTSKYKNQITGTFIDNHDTERFATGLKKQYIQQKMQLALSFIYSIQGIPIVYYGSEVLMKSKKGKDPATGRQLMPWNKIDENSSLMKYIRKLNFLRKNYSALSNGSTIELYKDYSKYIFLRQSDSNEVMVVLNNSFYEESTDVSIPRNSLFFKKSLLQDFLSKRRFVIKDKNIQITIPAKTAFFFVIKKEIISSNKNSMRRKNTFFHTVKKSSFLPKDVQLVEFTLPFNNEKNVYLAGDFNGWNASSLPFQKRKNKWRIKIPLRKGGYSYKFIRNNKWIRDPKEKQNTGKPYFNSVIIVK